MKAILSRIRQLFTPAKRLPYGLPTQIIPAAEFLLTGKCSDDVRSMSDRVEGLRKKIADRGETPVNIIYSPKPGTAGDCATSEMRPEHGEVMQFTMKQVATTGKNARWGTALHLLAASSGSRTLLELGSCAGISGCYLASVPSCDEFLTIEGSAPLAALAAENLATISPKARVYNKLFDEALDEILPGRTNIDFAFIDGHHEKVATIHYWQRIAPHVRPGAVVVFDDISWSQDMRDCWNTVSRQTGFSDAIDFGTIGVCIWDGGESVPQYHDLQPVLGKREIGQPRGWK